MSVAPSYTDAELTTRDKSEKLREKIRRLIMIHSEETN